MRRTPGFKERLNQAMDRAGLNQSELARRLGIKPQSVQGWVSGESEPRGYRFQKLAQILGVSEEWLLTGAENPQGVREPGAAYFEKEIPTGPDLGRTRFPVREEAKWWEETVRARVVAADEDLAGYFDKAVRMRKRTRFRLDFLSPKLAAEMKVMRPDSLTGPTLFMVRDTLWRMAVLRSLDESLEVERRYILYLLWADEPTDETSRSQEKIEDLQWEAEEMGLEVQAISEPTEAAVSILKIHDYQPDN